MEDWSRVEVEAIVSDYLEMLDLEIRGVPFNKAERNRNLQKLLPERTRGSIERKHMNISAAMIDLGFPYVEGYKPNSHRQNLLNEVVESRIAESRALEGEIESLVQAIPENIGSPADILSIAVPPPKKNAGTSTSIYEDAEPRRRTARRNYLEVEARNSALGLAGEKLVMGFEHERLWRAGKRGLAERISHASVEEGDGLGFDILSFETDGRERLVEVKTTRFGQWTPFFASQNEVEVSDSREPAYYLYRLYKFGTNPRLFTLHGSLVRTCRLDPLLYSAIPA